MIFEGDAADFACNAVVADNRIAMNACSSGLRVRLEAEGFWTFLTPLTEFLRAGGSAKCLTLRLDEATAA